MRGWFLLGVIVAAGLVAAPAWACSCALPGTPHEELAQADAVFAARALNVRNADGERRATLFVVLTFKGGVEETVDVRTAQDSATCGFPFKKGEAYLVYAYRSDGGWHTHSCSRTARLEDAGEDLAAFDAAGLKAEPLGDDGGCGGPSNIAAVQSIFFVLLGVGWMRRRASKDARA